MRLNQITIKVTDLEASIEFYKKLGLRLIVCTGNPYARFEDEEGNTTFSLSVVDQAIPGDSGLYFETDDLENEVVRLQRAGINFETEITKHTYLWTEIWFRDPDGHRLCLYHAGRNRRFPPWRL